MRNVVLIGAGQLGSRHLQALAKSTVPLAIHVLDPNVESLKVAASRFEEIDRSKEVSAEFHTSWDGIPNRVSLAVIATNAEVRAAVTDELLKRAAVEAVIFEKVLFPAVSEYDAVEALLSVHGVKAWVNCPRRKFPVYRALKEVVAGGGVSMVVTGGNFGLGCNAIHFIDLFSFLSGSSDVAVDASGLEPGYIPSKRPSYLEFTGRLMAYGANMSSLLLWSGKNPELPMSMSISAENVTAVIDEVGGKVRLADKSSAWSWREESFRFPYQSEMTHLDLQAILEGNDPGLATFAESKSLHLPMLKAFLQHLDKTSNRKGLERCPIT